MHRGMTRVIKTNLPETDKPNESSSTENTPETGVNRLAPGASGPAQPGERNAEPAQGDHGESGFPGISLDPLTGDLDELDEELAALDLHLQDASDSAEKRIYEKTLSYYEMTLDASIAAGTPLPRYAHAKEMLRTAIAIRVSAQKQRKLEIEASRLRLKTALERRKLRTRRASLQQNRRNQRTQQRNSGITRPSGRRSPAVSPGFFNRGSPQAPPSAQTAQITQTTEARAVDRQNILPANHSDAETQRSPADPLLAQELKQNSHETHLAGQEFHSTPIEPELAALKLCKEGSEASHRVQPANSPAVSSPIQSLQSAQPNGTNPEAAAIPITPINAACDPDAAGAQSLQPSTPTRALRPSRMEIALRYKRLRKQLNPNVPSVRFIELIGQYFEKDDQTILVLAATLA